MRKIVACGIVWLVAGCASQTSAGEPEVIGAPAPEAAPGPRRQAADSTVWRSPFAVQHLGDRPQRQSRPRVVQVERAPDTAVVAAAPAPPPEEPPAARAPAPRPPAARPATPRPSRPTPPARATPSARPRSSTITHLVVKGDTLYSIARRYRVSVERLQEVNNLPDDTIKLGQTLTIPLS